MKINNFRGDLAADSARKEALACTRHGHLLHACEPGSKLHQRVFRPCVSDVIGCNHHATVEMAVRGTLSVALHVQHDALEIRGCSHPGTIT